VRYLLDTNACIAYLTGRSPRVLEQLQCLAAEEVALCSIAIARGLTLVTRNPRELGRVPGLVLEDWETGA
jgi:predicted nucleic acid-binding protein